MIGSLALFAAIGQRRCWGAPAYSAARIKLFPISRFLVPSELNRFASKGRMSGS